MPTIISDAFQLTWQFLPRYIRALMCRCAGDDTAMVGCPYWRNVFVQERMWEALMEIAHNIKEKEDEG